MEFVIGIVSSVVSTAVEYTISPIQNQMKYLTGHEKRVESLKTQVERLKDARWRLEHDVDAAKRNGEEIERDVDKWLTEVDKKIAEDVEKVMQDEEKAKKKCFVGVCPNLWARYKYNVKAEEEAKAVAELLEHGKFDRVSYRVPPQQGIKVAGAAVKGFETFESRRVVLDGIMEALKDDSINILGVHGMGGVGKTTLVKEVAALVKKGNLFDSVVIATVTHELNVEKVQNQIADMLGLTFVEQSMEGRALRLQERLKKEEKLLIVLDDIWARFSLEEVGIPVGHQGCKILLTSRELNVLSSGMNSDKNFTIGPLGKEESWTLFKKMAGDVVESRDLKPTAIQIANKCAGLPIATATVAGALRNKKLFEWKNALTELNRPSTRNLRGVAKDVYSAIELSYKYLESEEIKFTFLLCSLLGHNGLIEDLLRYIIGMGVFHDINTIEEARNRVLTSVSKLKASCLLLDSYNDEWFDIHDVVWDVALSIASRDHHMLVLRNGTDELKEWPHNCTAMSLLSASIIGELPDEIECPNLSFFFMDNDGSVQIPANFFRGTERIKVLDLIGMHFQSLPLSFNFLADLRTLRLNRCTLEDISTVGNLKNLEILSLARSDIDALPKETGELTQLRLLDLNNCTELKIIPPGVLSSLIKLEELYMENSFVRWEDGAVGCRRRNASLEELNHLRHLTTLYVDIPDARIIPKHLFTQNLDRYRIVIGDKWDLRGQYEYSRTLRFQSVTRTFMNHHGVKILLKKSEDLYLHQLEDIKNVLGELNNEEDFSDLKILHIKNGSEVQYIATENDKFPQLQSMSLKGLWQLISFCSEDSSCSSSSKPLPLFNKQLVFPQLESLELSSINVERIWDSPLSEIYFFAANLTSLIIERCGNLQNLLSPSIARSVVNQLTSLEITACQSLREIISTEEIEDEKVVICFARLNSLKIRDLSNLVKFCSGECNVEFPSLQVLEIEGCAALKEFITNEKCQLDMRALFNDKVALPSLERPISFLGNVKMIFSNQLLASSFYKLEELRVRNCDSLELIFELSLKHHASNKASLQEINLTFQNLRNVEIWGCENLKNIFPVSIATDLPQLEHLRVSDCEVLEEIVSAGEEVFEEPVGFKFAKVSSIVLLNLRDLKCFYPGKHTIVWPMLKILEITGYPTLLKIIGGIQEVNRNNPPQSGQGQPLFSVEKVIPMLEELQLTNCFGDTSKICDCQFPANLFHHIKVLKVLGSHTDRSATFPCGFLQRFYNLESLEFCYCDFKDLVSSEGDDAEKPETLTLTHVLQVKTLKLKFIDSLKHIWMKDSELGHNIDLHTLEILEVERCNDFISFGPSSASFQNLITLKVERCEMMINLVTPSVAQNLVQLTTMTIEWCDRMTEIIAANEGNIDDAILDEITFNKLQYLELNCLESLASFCPGDYTIKFPCLQDLIVNRCRSLKIFSKGVLSCPKLWRVRESSIFHSKGRWAGDLNTTIQILYIEEAGLQLSDAFPELMEIWNGRNPQQNLDFKRLQRLEVCNCSSLKLNYILTVSMALSLNLLRVLVVKECSNLKDVIVDLESEVEATTMSDNYLMIFPRLWSIQIESCFNLISFYLGSAALVFPSMENIKIVDCPKMTTFASSSFSSTAQGNEEKVAHVDLKFAAPFFSDKAECPKLRELDLSSINIREIWHHQQLQSSLCFQNLKEFTVKECHNLKYLFPHFMVKHFVQLFKLHICDCKMMEEVIFMEEEERMSPMFLPKLRDLELKDLPKLSRFCHENYLEFPSLISLTLENCSLLETFPCKETKNAKGNNIELEVSALFNEKVALSQLGYLTIKSMRKCRKIWPQQITGNSFLELKSIRVENCENLLNIFPLNMMEKLEELMWLNIVNCDSLEEIFEPQAVIDYQSQSIVEDTVMTKFVFPRVVQLRFDKLTKLKRFYSRLHATEWSWLREMEVIECRNVQIFASNCPGRSTDPQPLFQVNEVTFPVLEELKVTLNDTWDGQVLSTMCFQKLKVLELTGIILENSTALPHCFFQSLPNLEKLVMKDASLRQIFQFEGLSDDERHALALTELSELRLLKLPEMTHLWQEGFQPPTAFRKLEILQVLDCCKFKTLAPYLESFNNLTSLEVSGCHGFINLLTCSTAKTLMQLKRMSIIDCQKMKEIVACDDDEILEGAIVFSQLTYLQLSCLPSLASFCLVDHSLKFPTLQEVIVKECPNMMIFCKGDLSTPKLRQVQLTGDDEENGQWNWKGDLKTTIRQLFEEMKLQSSEVTEGYA